MQILKPHSHSWFKAKYLIYPPQQFNPMGRYKVLVITNQAPLCISHMTYDQLNLLGAV